MSPRWVRKITVFTDELAQPLPTTDTCMDGVAGACAVTPRTQHAMARHRSGEEPQFEGLGVAKRMVG